jgi:hypothetical protein
MEANIAKIKSAPVVALFAYDMNLVEIVIHDIAQNSIAT